MIKWMDAVDGRAKLERDLLLRSAAEKFSCQIGVADDATRIKKEDEQRSKLKI